MFGNQDLCHSEHRKCGCCLHEEFCATKVKILKVVWSFRFANIWSTDCRHLGGLYPTVPLKTNCWTDSHKQQYYLAESFVAFSNSWDKQRAPNNTSLRDRCISSSENGTSESHVVPSLWPFVRASSGNLKGHGENLKAWHIQTDWQPNATDTFFDGLLWGIFMNSQLLPSPMKSYKRDVKTNNCMHWNTGNGLRDRLGSLPSLYIIRFRASCRQRAVNLHI